MFGKIIFALVIASACAAPTEPAVENEIMLTFFFGATGSIQYNVLNFHTIFDHASFVRTRRTVIYHYGFSQTPNSDNVVDLVASYRATNDVNFVLVHYNGITQNTVGNARAIGDAIGMALVRLFELGSNPAQMHLVGFSLGAQIMSLTSRAVRAFSNNRHFIGRLTGLDPGQLGTWANSLGRLSSTDAAFVDTIHTEAVGFGDHESRGHVQFYPNGGVSQPFCTGALETTRQTCSHNFAVFAWSESVRARVAIFPSLPCSTWTQFSAGQCNSNTPIGNMGSVSQTTLRNTYFLRTNMAAPWSRNVATP